MINEISVNGSTQYFLPGNPRALRVVDVYIGANCTNTRVPGKTCASYSLTYGHNDTRNLTELVPAGAEQTHASAQIHAVIRAQRLLKDDEVLVIHSKTPRFVLNGNNARTHRSINSAYDGMWSKICALRDLNRMYFQ